MQPEQYPLMRAQEERHWWYRGNRAVVAALLRRYAPTGCRLRLDAGCGTGKNLEAFADFGVAIGIDYDHAAVRFSRDRGCTRVARASITALPFAGASFDVVTCFEVMNSDSIADWQGVVKEFARVLRPGGVLFLREPAFMALYGSHDVVVHTARRFRRAPMRAAVERAGLQVLRCSYQNLVTFFPALVIRSFQRWRGLAGRSHVADFEKGDTVLGPLLAAWLRGEGWWLARVRLPLGSSVVCVARKPAAP
jgi:SAM-dependent methyltransferase